MNNFDPSSITAPPSLITPSPSIITASGDSATYSKHQPHETQVNSPKMSQPSETRSNDDELVDLIGLTFGHILEGLQFPIADESLPGLRERWQRRRDLAQLAVFPDGYEFENELIDGSVRSVILLTPPDLVAVRRSDGTWIRRRRQDADPAEPYSLRWYLEYLRQSGLPFWFMRPEHLSIIDNDVENEILDIVNETRDRALQTLPPRNYTEVTYPTTPEYPAPGQSLYGYDLSGDEIDRLARQFPAVAANATMDGYRIYIMPSGHILIRHRNEIEGMDKKHDLRNRVTWKKALTNVASFISEGEDHALPSDSVTIPTTNRADEVEAAELQGGIVDINQVPRGSGDWVWLNDDVDEPLAASLNLYSPLEVTTARENGLFRGGIPQNAIPRVVYFPHHLNPARQPTTRGSWQYLTTGEDSSEAYAHLNLGGQGPLFTNNPRPSAADVQQLRENYQLYINRGEMSPDADLTTGIDIVWEESEQPADNPPPDGGAGSGSDDGSEQELDPNVTDVDSRLDHDPLNGGANDQTSNLGTRLYQTKMVAGKKVTIDSSTARPNRPEPHKFWMPTARGQWLEWEHGATLDWTKRKEVDKLNRWREQQRRRAEYPPKRKDSRQDYTHEQRKFLFDNFVVPGKGERILTPAKEIARQFNAKFKAKRVESGITLVLGRLKQEYHDNNGQMVVHKGRTGKRKSRGDDEGEGQAPPKKKQKKDGGKEAEVESDESDDGSDYAP